MDINKASKDQLIELEGVGRTLAARFIKARPIRKLEDLVAVKGVKPALIQLLRDQNVIVGRPAAKKVAVQITGMATAEDGLSVSDPTVAWRAQGGAARDDRGRRMPLPRREGTRDRVRTPPRDGSRCVMAGALDRPVVDALRP